MDDIAKWNGFDWVCVKSTHTRSVNSCSLSVPGGSYSSSSCLCPFNTTAVGGGFKQTIVDDVHLVSSYPDVLDTAWRFTVLNNTSSSKLVTLQVVCLESGN